MTLVAGKGPVQASRRRSRSASNQCGRRFACPERGVNQGPGPIEHVRPLVHVLVERDRRRGVPERHLHRLDARPGVDQQRRVLVPQAMEPPARRQSDLLPNRRPGTGERRRNDRIAAHPAEDERGDPSSWPMQLGLLHDLHRRVVVFQVLPQGRRHHVRQLNRPYAGLRLRSPQVRRPPVARSRLHGPDCTVPTARSRLHGPDLHGPDLHGPDCTVTTFHLSSKGRPPGRTPGKFPPCRRRALPLRSRREPAAASATPANTPKPDGRRGAADMTQRRRHDRWPCHGPAPRRGDPRRM
jgi:hypothetical protein